MTASTLTTSGSTLLVPGAEELAATAPIEDAQVRAYTVAQGPGLTVMCITFDTGTVLADHLAKGPILIQTMTGEMVVEVDGSPVRLPLGGVMHLDGGVSHAVRAVTRGRILLTLLPGGESEEPAVPGIIRKSMATPEDADLIPLTDVSGQNGHDAHGDHGCTCGEADEALPELDVRTIPHAIRHATVFGALTGLRPQSSMILTAHHNPVPLLAQIEQLFEGAIDVAYREEGPEVWKLQMTRTR